MNTANILSRHQGGFFFFRKNVFQKKKQKNRVVKLQTRQTVSRTLLQYHKQTRKMSKQKCQLSNLCGEEAPLGHGG